DRMPGLSNTNPDGGWSGFFVDFCRAGAAAIFKNPDAVLVGDYWLDALEGRTIDVLHAGSTWTFERDVGQNLDFPAVYLYDGQGFISYAHLGAKTLEDAKTLSGVQVCAIETTSTALTNLLDFMARNRVDWTVVPIQTMDGMWAAFFGGRCQMVVHDRTALVAVHAGRLEGSKDFVVFPEVISKEPLSPAVRGDDPRWRDFVAWTVLATVAAEELGVTRANVDDMKANAKDPEVRRLLGGEPGIGRGFGLDDEWAYRVIKAVGNYGEIFDRNVGEGSPFKMSRGLNRLWRDGGLLYPPPIR
ncbi:MAG: transporter substrate-binding domain-containing protein, partial [Alphaproteobacteria bacterium]|nr:transporter substrate-binding domain-containing protein [Alphaproteobacteria bacterium]